MSSTSDTNAKQVNDLGREIDHEFKSHPDVFWPAVRGHKTFEFRKDDRGGYLVGQTVRLRCYDPDHGYHGHPPLDRYITNILRGGEFGLQDGYCILSLAALTPPPSADAGAGLRGALEWIESIAVHNGYQARQCLRSDIVDEGAQIAARLRVALAASPAGAGSVGGEAREKIADRFMKALPDLSRLDALCAAENAFPECLAPTGPIGAHIAKIEAERDAAQDHLAKVTSVVKAAAIGEWTDNYEAMVEEACAFEERTRTAEAQVATLTARIAELSETHTDENGTVWSPPTAWAYAQACKALSTKRDRIAELEAALEPFDKFAGISFPDDSLCTIRVYASEVRAVRAVLNQKDTDR